MSDEYKCSKCGQAVRWFASTVKDNSRWLSTQRGQFCVDGALHEPGRK